MTNFHDPKVIQANASEPLYLSPSRASSSVVHSSDFGKTPSCHGGNIYVRHYLIFLALRDNSSRWEYITTIQFEWEIITGQRKCRWTILVRFADRIGLWSLPDSSHIGAKLYSGCRLSTLLAIVALFIPLNSTTPIDCKVGGVSSPLNRRLAQPIHVAAMLDFFICAFAGVQSYVVDPVTMFSASGLCISCPRVCIRPHRAPRVSLRVQVRTRSYGVFPATE